MKTLMVIMTSAILALSATAQAEDVTREMEINGNLVVEFHCHRMQW